MKCVLFVALLGGCLNPSIAVAQTISGNTLYESCTSDQIGLEGFCVGYIAGLVEGQFWGGLLLAKMAGIELETQDFNAFANQAFQHCIPPEAPNEQLRDVVVAHLRDNPATRHESARFLVWEAYREAFPCK